MQTTLGGIFSANRFFLTVHFNELVKNDSAERLSKFTYRYLFLFITVYFYNNCIIVFSWFYGIPDLANKNINIIVIYIKLY